MATANNQTERLTINSEEEAIATLQRALAQEFSNKVVDLDFEDWPSIKLKYVGPKFHGTVTPEIAQALVDLQEAMNRSYMVAVRGTTNLQGLGEEEKRELELIARVDENCTLLLIDLGPWAEKLATELVSKMTGTELIITVVSTATVLTAGWVVKSYLKDRSENKGLELAKDERIQLSQEETRRHQILVTALTQNAPARTANELAQEPRNSLMKSAIEAESFTYQDAVTITGEEARQTYRAQRRTALEVQLNGTYTVEGFNWNEPPRVSRRLVGLSGHLCQGVAVGKLPPVVCLSFCRRDTPDRREQSDVVEPVHPLQGRQFHGFPGLPGAPAMNQFGLV